VSSIAPPRVVSIADLRRLAKRRLPRIVFDYIDGGAEDEWTLQENSQAFRDVMLRPRCAVATSAVNAKTTVLGTNRSPFPPRPLGSSRVFYPRGECMRPKPRADRNGLHPLDVRGVPSRGRARRFDRTALVSAVSRRRT
jgi:hypothetical protein